jgi:hypothetical protein
VWFSRASQLEIGLSSCVLVLVAISPRRAKLGGSPRGMRPAGSPPPIPAAGGPVAGARLGIEPLDAKPSWHRAVVFDNSQSFY